MKTNFKFTKCIKSLLVLTLTMIMISSNLVIFAKDIKGEEASYEPEQLIYNFIDAVNSKDTETYLSLFTNDNKVEMEAFIEQNGNTDFFKESNIEIKNLKKLSDEVGKESANLTDDEYTKYNDIAVYYTEENTTVKDDNDLVNTDTLSNGYTYKDYVIVKENNEWKILRVSTANIIRINSANEGFGTANEENKLNDQKNEISIIPKSIITDETNLESLAKSSSLSTPTSVTVYFTKSANSNHYGVTHKSITWSTYLKNVLPNEWIISYYGSYPAYIFAGTMASKMYAWYYTVYPKWNYAPYYSDVKDDSNDQNFLYNSYSSLTSTYQGYVDNAYNLMNSAAIVTSANHNLFEVHYHATNGSYHSGTLSASGCLSQAKSGSAYADILHYYYDSSTYTNNDTITLVTY